MRALKCYLTLSREEYRLLLAALVRFKNMLTAQGRYTDAVDEIILKLAKAK